MASIYIIENKENRKRYVGKTTLEDPYRRWQQHKYNAKSNHNPMVISEAISKYGVDNFTFYVIETCKDEDVDKREIYWINKFDTYKNGYNSTLGGEGVKRDIYLLTNSNIRPISCYTLNGEHIKDYDSRGIASKELGILKTGITACIKGTTFQCGGYRWTWKNEDLVDIKRRSNNRSKIYGIHKNGDKKVWNSQADCAEDIEGNRKVNANIGRSINSTNDNKFECKGWYLFRENVETFIAATPNRFTTETATKAALKH